MTEHRLCALNDIPNGKQKLFRIGDRELVAIRMNAEVHVITNRCTHLAKRLYGGRVMGDQIMCPFHAGCFSLRDGKALSGPVVEPIEVHEAQVREGEVFVVLRRIEGAGFESAPPEQ